MSPVTAISCFLTISSIQFVSGNVIETRIMGKSFDVSPIVLLLALMFFGLVWGILGMFLATPIVSIIKIIFQKHESTRPFAELMAGRLSVVNSIAAENQN
jgi:AI-2 transport protein TqsA